MGQILLGIAVGICAGFASGFLGVSPGGILVPVTILLTGCEQHVAQGVSLFCQIAPTSLSGLRRYRIKDGALPTSPPAMLAVTFMIGAVAGALVSGRTPARTLQWAYVAYLGLLEMILLTSGAKKTRRSLLRFNHPALNWQW
jgi:uncharacterized membrane protein YfcA